MLTLLSSRKLWETLQEFTRNLTAHALRVNRILEIIEEFLVSKETVVLRRWERSKQKFGSIKRVDKG